MSPSGVKTYRKIDRYKHLLDACPDSWETMKKRYNTLGQGVESHTQNDRGKIQCIKREQKAFKCEIPTKSVSDDETDIQVAEFLTEVASLRADILNLQAEMQEIRNGITWWVKRKKYQ